ncbi:uncharacterized protein SCHCODRAFT_02118467 [Schizophyllum commune H4-8]|uniref:uncharacterized protein n=1 Tax=Schizophyllum commune (strain H4-8 / FGSC 9210) TaxID=578458 RepID=UPI00216008E2|nr:uncharacterized protein SCHCODRAFT_02118467 [Schizophyllum commune H4-8]KAI5885555.1 hypothetical protein SCHCODRAFT_02118467 [Schizophyllum commune H4-8]
MYIFSAGPCSAPRWRTASFESIQQSLRANSTPRGNTACLAWPVQEPGQHTGKLP